MLLKIYDKQPNDLNKQVREREIENKKEEKTGQTFFPQGP